MKKEDLNKILKLLEEIKDLKCKDFKCCEHDWRFFSDKKICFKCGEVEYFPSSWTYTHPPYWSGTSDTVD